MSLSLQPLVLRWNERWRQRLDEEQVHSNNNILCIVCVWLSGGSLFLSVSIFCLLHHVSLHYHTSFSFYFLRCRCKVSFDMQNFFEYKPALKRCHLVHLNDNKYRCAATCSTFCLSLLSYCQIKLHAQAGCDYLPTLIRFVLPFPRFQSKRTKHVYDKGDVTAVSPLYRMLGGKWNISGLYGSLRYWTFGLICWDVYGVKYEVKRFLKACLNRLEMMVNNILLSWVSPTL